MDEGEGLGLLKTCKRYDFMHGKQSVGVGREIKSLKEQQSVMHIAR